MTNSIQISLPIKNYTKISSYYGNRDNPTGSGEQFHKGIDFAAPIGAEVFAVKSGTIKQIGWDPSGFGNRITIQYDDGSIFQGRYGHLNDFAEGLKERFDSGENIKVEAGQLIGYVGSTGSSTGPHLHYEESYFKIKQETKKQEKVAQDPLPQFKQLIQAQASNSNSQLPVIETKLSITSTDQNQTKKDINEIIRDNKSSIEDIIKANQFLSEIDQAGNPNQSTRNSKINIEYSEGKEYTIKPGDTLSKIAQDNNTTIDKLLELNPNIEDPDQINAGDSILIPQNISYPILPLDQIINNLSSSFDIAERTLSPIILDLNGDGIGTTKETINNINSIYFDHNNDGFAEITGWVDKNDGLLVRDLNNNNQIDSGRELFGSETLLNNSNTNSSTNSNNPNTNPNNITKAANGFEALKELDSNNDNQIDANDINFTQLKIWQDLNQDGKTQEGELKTLSEANIKSISTSYQNNNFIDSNGNIHKQISTYTTNDNITRSATDVWFKTNPIYSKSTDNITISNDIKSLPNIEGYGKVHSLHEAMQLDVSGKLKELVNNFINTTNEEDQKAMMNDILFKWTGVEGINPNILNSNLT